MEHVDNQPVATETTQRTPDAAASDTANLRRALVSLLPDLRAYARFLARRPGEADDLVQEALVRALTAAHQFQAGTNARAWAFTILRNTFFEQVRRRRTERAAMQDGKAEGQRASAPAQQDQIDLDDLSRHLFRLSPLLRDALVLVGAQGLGYDEAAQICGVPLGTMKARVSRARSLLARSMTARRPEPQ